MKRLLVSLSFWFIVIDISGQATSVFNLMKQDGIVDIYLKLDWNELEKKKSDKAYCPAVINFTKENKESFSAPLKVRPRGNMRLKICSFPPLKLKFDKNELASRSLASHNEMDLVHHCHPGDQYDQFVLREYLAYKLYREISPYSFEAQLVRLNYLNTDETIAYEPSLAFMVENQEELVDRLGGKKYKTSVISQNALDAKSFLMVCLFQFMIGNTDWYIVNRHNLEFVIIPGHSLLVTVPYDFDYSGFVSAPYAAHHESINLPSVALRYYQGRCEPEEEVYKALDIFKEKKDVLLNMYTQIPGLSEHSIKHVQKYLEDFFTIIENPKKTESYILKHCGKWPVEN